MTRASRSPRRAQHAGISVIEVVLVLAIVAILAAIAAPNFRSSQESAQLDTEASLLRGGIEMARAKAVRSRQNATLTLSGCGASMTWAVAVGTDTFNHSAASGVTCNTTTALTFAPNGLPSAAWSTTLRGLTTGATRTVSVSVDGVPS